MHNFLVCVHLSKQLTTLLARKSHFSKHTGSGTIYPATSLLQVVKLARQFIKSFPPSGLGDKISAVVSLVKEICHRGGV